MPKNLPFSGITRLQQVFREVLGRDLTLEEQKYLGLSGTAVPLADFEQAREKRDSKKAKAS
jgi:hypothetical protein